MPAQESPLVVLKNADISKHGVWLERRDHEGGPIDLDLRMSDSKFVEPVREIVTGRLTAVAGSPPEVEELPTGAYYAYPRKARRKSETLYLEASNTLRDLADACDEERPLEDTLDDYVRRMKADPVIPENELTVAEVVALKPVLRENEIQGVIRDVLRQMPGNALEDSVKQGLINAVSRQVRDFPRPPLLNDAVGTDGVVDVQKDPLFLGIQAALEDSMGRNATSGGILLAPSALPSREAYVARQIYDALVDAYRERATEMQR